jgi:Uma2 family endonuclease
MTAVTKASRWISPEDYLEGEKLAEIRHEYLAGEVYAMAGTSTNHNEIALNIAAWLRTALRGGPCRTFIESVKVRINPRRETLFYYPDVFVACDPREKHEYYRDYPAVIFEVLSPDTARFDQREKRFAYQTIETLQTYVLVDQHKVEISLWQRAGDDWEPMILNALEDTVPLPGLNLALPVSEIYAGITFVPAA